MSCLYLCDVCGEQIIYDAHYGEDSIPTIQMKRIKETPELDIPIDVTRQVCHKCFDRISDYIKNYDPWRVG